MNAVLSATLHSPLGWFILINHLISRVTRSRQSIRRFLPRSSSSRTSGGQGSPRWSWSWTWSWCSPQARRLFCDSFVLSLRADENTVMCGLNNGCVQVPSHLIPSHPIPSNPITYCYINSKYFGLTTFNSPFINMIEKIVSRHLETIQFRLKYYFTSPHYRACPHTTYIHAKTHYSAHHPTPNHTTKGHPPLHNGANRHIRPN